MTPTGVSDAERSALVLEDVERDLLVQVARGGGAAFECLYDLYSRSVYSLALQILHDPDQAQDVAQEVFLGIWRAAHAFDPGRGSVRSWILALAHHKSVDAVRRRRVRTGEPLPEVLLADRDVAEDAARNIEAARLHRALGELSAAQRESITLAYYGGLTQQQIAARLGVPLGTVKTRIRDGMLRLRAALTPPLPRP